MARIQILPDILASQVAAGEVVERPASVVKELVENSLDAGAGEVLVEIRRGGAMLIRVTDDGCGMNREDALLSLERHATSKLSDEAGLHRVQTLGFRGEAVPSIASVSKFRLVTRLESQIAGTEIKVNGGVVGEVREAGCAVGSMIEVRDLFYNVPARRKFLKTETTESAHIEHQLRLHALAAEGVRFRFRKDEREVFELAAGMSRLERVRWAVGTSLGGEIVPLPETSAKGLRVGGFLLPAAHARKGRRHQCVFLNGRPVEDSAISRGLIEGFRGGLQEGLHPAAWLWIQIDPALVDVNVHPAKREIRLHRPHDLREAVAESVRSGLAARAQNKRMPDGTSRDRHQAPAAAMREPIPVPTRKAWANAPAERVLPLTPAREAIKSADLPAPRVPEFRFIGVLASRYSLLESEDGLVVFDPQAARERILYEKWMVSSEAGGSVETQALLVPLVLEPGPREAEVLLRHRELFGDAGFDLEDFGAGSVRVGAAPAFLDARGVSDLLLEVVDDLLEGGSSGGKFAQDRLAKILARRAAMRESARPEEATALLKHLFACDLPYCAADGRPTMSEISIRELEKRFGG